MSRADSKRKVFTTISAYTSLNQERKKLKQTDIFTSVNNKSDVVPYLLDVLKCVAGTDALKETIGGMFTKLIGKVEPTLKTTLKKQFVQSNADEGLPTSFKNNGITVSAKSIDVNGKLMASPSSSEGNLLYDKVVPNFDSVAHDAIVNSGTDKPFANMLINYNATTDKFQIKPKLDVVPNPNIGDYFSTYIDNAQIINKKEIMTNVMDGIYGTMAKKQKKTVEQAYNELLVEQLLEQVMNDDDSFEISPAKYDELLQKAGEMAAGVVYYDMGCGQMAAELSFDDLNSLITTISGSTDPFLVGNQIEGTIDQSAISEDVTAENKQTIKDGFFQRIIKILTNKLLQAVTTAPQVRVLLGMMSSLQNNGVVELSLAKDDMKNFKTCIKCMAKEIMKLVAEFIFGLAVTYLMILLKPIIKKIIKEKINQYVNIIKSLTPAGRIAATLTG